MKRIVLGLILGLMMGSTVHGQEGVTVLNDVGMESVGSALFEVPKRYGRLVNVAVSSDIHHLYFQDGAGRIRIVLLGRRGAVQHARAPIQLLTSDVYVLERELPDASDR